MYIPKKKIKLFLSLAICSVILLSGISAFAVTYIYAASDVSYNNNVSGLDSDNVQDAIDELHVEANDYEELNKKIWPVGSIYLSITDDTVAKVEEKLGGTWVAFGQGRTLVGVGTGTDSNNASKSFTVNSTGGEYNHTLALTEAPAHTHTRGTMQISGTLRINSDSGNAGVDAPGAGTGAIAAVNGTGCGSSGGGCNWNVWSGFNFTASNNWTGATSSAGGGGAHNNIQPYITVYMYKRTE